MRCSLLGDGWMMGCDYNSRIYDEKSRGNVENFMQRIEITQVVDSQILRKDDFKNIRIKNIF